MNKKIKLEYLNVTIYPFSLEIEGDFGKDDIIGMPKAEIETLKELVKSHRKRLYRVQSIIDIWEDHKAQDISKFSMSKVPTKKRKKKKGITDENAREFYDLVKKEIKKGAKEIMFNGNKVPMNEAKLIIEYFNKKGVL